LAAILTLFKPTRNSLTLLLIPRIAALKLSKMSVKLSVMAPSRLRAREVSSKLKQSPKKLTAKFFALKMKKKPLLMMKESFALNAMVLK